MVYKKLFNIKYNNKRFCIFIDNYERRTFLEINDLGEYQYPTLEDFLYLNSIYNNHNDKILYEIKKYTYQEKVRVLTGLLTVTLIFNSLNGSLLKSKTTVSENSISIEEVVDNKTISIEDNSELDSILGYQSVSLDKVYKAIESNNNLPLDYKDAAHDLVNALVSKYPDIDLRIFYENIKTLKVVETTKEELTKESGSEYIAGFYSSVDNKIVTTTDKTYETLIHELAHIFDCYYRNIDGIVYEKSVSKGRALKEAMTNVTANALVETPSYKNEGLILEYLSKCVNFNYNDYNKKGIWYLIKLLKDKYPSIDIDYIIDSSDTMRDSEFIDEHITLEQNPDLLDELFLICKENIKNIKDDIYEPFRNFTILLQDSIQEDLLIKYYNQYIELLAQIGYTGLPTSEEILESYQLYSNTTFLAYRNDEICPVEITNEANQSIYKKINSDGTKDNINSLDYILVGKSELQNYIKFACFKYPDIIGTEDFWKKVASDYDLINENSYEQISLYQEGKLLFTDYASNIYIAVGVTEENKLGFILSNKEETLFKTDENLKNISNYINFGDYIKNIKEKTIHLEDILNETYLKQLENLFYNVSLKEDEITIDPLYKVSITPNGTSNDYKVIMKLCNVQARFDYNLNTYLDPILNIGFYQIALPSDYASIIEDNIIYLEDILNYYNLLDENNLEYHFTEEELKDLCTNYLNDYKNINKSRIKS